MKRPILHVLLALAALVLGLELFLRLLPVSTATLVADHLGAGIPTVPPHHRWTMATGWDLRNAQTLQANAQGFAARHDFVADPRAVALIGDSYVEASMLPANDRLDAQLERQLSARPVYAMGSPGSALLDYGHRLQWAVRQFQVQDVVLLLEQGDVIQSRCGSGNNQSVCWDPRRAQVVKVATPSPGWLKRVGRHSALAQYLMSQLRLSASGLWANAKAQAQPAQGHDVGKRAAEPQATSQLMQLDAAERAEIDQIARYFFGQRQGWSGRMVLVMDADRAGLKRGERGSNPARDHFMALARAEGIRVVDMAPIYAEHLRTSPLSVEVGPYDGHLNALGLALVARAAAQALVDPAP